jgi:hypothetical protein
VSTSKGTKRQYPQSPSSSPSPASYMAVALTPRNYLIHAYRVRDNLVPFDCEEEFCPFRDTLKAAIWAESAQHGNNRELVVKDWSYRRNGDSPGGLGIIYCLTPTRQNRILHLIVTIGLGIHVIETRPVLEGGLVMSFRKPQFGPQNIAELLEAIFTCNGLEGPERCRTWEERMDTPKMGPPSRSARSNSLPTWRSLQGRGTTTWTGRMGPSTSTGRR